MNETLKNTIEKVEELLHRLKGLKEINSVDELRLVLIKAMIEEAEDRLNEFGKKLYNRVKQ